MKHQSWVPDAQVRPPTGYPPHSQHSCRAQVGPSGRTNKCAARPPHSQALKQRMSRWIPASPSWSLGIDPGLLTVPNTQMDPWGMGLIRQGDGRRRSGHVGGSLTQPGNPRRSRKGSRVPGAGRPGHTTSGWLLPLTQPAIVCARDGGGGEGNAPTHPVLPSYI